MAEEGTTTTVETPVDHTQESFSNWTPGSPPLQETPVVAETAVEPPVNTDTPPVEEPPKSETEHAWLKEFGEFKSPDEFKGHYTALKTEREQFEAKLKEAEGKTAYSSDAIAKMDAYARKLFQDGVTDPREIQRKVAAFMQEAATDYMELAKADPVAIIERSTREKYAALNFSEADIARVVKRETALPQKPNLEDYGNDATDPEYLSRMEAYEDARFDLTLKAAGIAAELEAKREKIDFQPKGVPTKEEKEKLQQEAWGRYNARLREFETGLAAIDVAGQKLDFPLEGEYLDAINKATMYPAEFMDQFYTEAGEPDPVAIGKVVAQIAAIPLLLERQRKEVTHKLTEEFDARMRNPGTTGTPQNGGGTPNTSYEDSFAQWGKERQNR